MDRRPARGWRRIVRFVVVAACAITVATPALLPGIRGAPRSQPCAPQAVAGSTSKLDLVIAVDDSEDMSSGDHEGLRYTAPRGIINGLDPGARVSVVRFNQDATLSQPLTSDRSRAIKALAFPRSTGTSDVGAGLRLALDQLESGARVGRQPTVLLLTDGVGGFDTSLTDAAASRGVRVFALGLGLDPDSTLLEAIAEQTRGAYSSAASFVGPLAPIRRMAGTGRDSDGDGLSDCREIQGAWDALGTRHITDPDDPDSDDDGLTDSQEVTNDLPSFGARGAAGLLHGPLGVRGFRYVVSDPNEPDSDADGAPDALEFDIGTQPWLSDSDGDGLRDGREVDALGTDPLVGDTDGDGEIDGWEVQNAAAGFDPVVVDEKTSKTDYARDFVLGAGCPEGVSACQRDSVAFLAGSLGGGLLRYKDVLDALGNLGTGHFVAAGVATAALVPVAGDAASVTRKSVHFISRLTNERKYRALAYLANAKVVPRALQLRIIRRIERSNVRALTSAGMTEDGLLRLVRAGADIELLARTVRLASRVQRSPGLFALESQGQRLLAGRIPGALTEQVFRCPRCPLNSLLNCRRVDIYHPVSQQAIEVKKGLVVASSVRNEVEKDVALLNDAATPIRSIEWAFLPDANGRLGPDPQLLAWLTENRIPFVVYLP